VDPGAGKAVAEDLRNQSAPDGAQVTRKRQRSVGCPSLTEPAPEAGSSGESIQASTEPPKDEVATQPATTSTTRIFHKPQTQHTEKVVVSDIVPVFTCAGCDEKTTLEKERKYIEDRVRKYQRRPLRDGAKLAVLWKLLAVELGRSVRDIEKIGLAAVRTENIGTCIRPSTQHFLF
jgi:hypothetical protein